MSWGCLVVSLSAKEASWAHLATSWGVLGASWAVLGASWVVLEASWGRLGPSWRRCPRPSWRRLEEQNRAKMGPKSDQERVENEKK